MKEDEALRVVPIKEKLERCASDAQTEQRPERVERVEPSVEAKHEFVEVRLQVIGRDAVVNAVDDRARRKVERKDPTAAIMWITTLEWHNVPAGFEAPAFEVKS